MDLAPSKSYPHFDLFAFVQPTARIPDFKAAVVLRCLRSKPDFFYLNLGLRFPGFAIFLCFFIEEFAVIEHPAYGRVGVRGDLYEIQIGLLCQSEGFIDGYDAFVFSVRVDEANLSGANLFIYPKV